MRRAWILTTAAAAGLGAALLPRLPGSPAAGAAGEAEAAVLDRSIAFFEEKLAGDDWNDPVRGQLLGRYLLRFGAAADLADVARAEALARELIAHSPALPSPQARLSAVLLMRHDFGGAMAAAERAVELGPDDEASLGALFDAAMAVGEYARAEQAMLRLDAGTVGRRLREAHWLEARGDGDAAAFALEAACAALQPGVVRPAVAGWCLTTIAGVELGRSGAAVAERLLADALRVHPGDRGATEALADLAHARGEWRAAAELYRRIAADAHPDLYLRLAEVERARGREREADAWTRRFLDVATRAEDEPLFGRELALFHADSPAMREAALGLALRDLERRRDVEGFDVLAWVRYRRGELDEALEASDRARAWGAPSATSDYHRARILEALGRGVEAEPLLESALARPELLSPHARLHAAAASEDRR